MDTSDIIRRAIALAQGGDKAQARQIVAEILQNDPFNADAWIVMAQIVDSPDEAIDCIRKALEIRPDDEHARRYLDYLQRQNPTANKHVSPLLIAGGAAAFLLLCITGVLLSGRLSPQNGTSATPTSLFTCRELIDSALDISNTNCQKIDLGEVCYGHTTLKASLQPGADGRFQEMGDVLSLERVAHISAVPLNVDTQEWGIGVFKVQANLPYTLPGQNITMVIAGNTSVDNAGSSMQVFSFSSGIGGLTCESVPVNGLIVRIPNGIGIRFTVNGSDLALSGNAFLQAETDKEMQVSMSDGGGWVSSKGVSRFFRAGETVSVPLKGTSASGPPDVRAGSPGELCALFDTCGSNAPTQTSDQAVAMIKTAVPESSGATGGDNLPAPGAPTNTSVPLDPRLPTNTPVPVAPGQPTNTSVPRATNTPVQVAASSGSGSSGGSSNTGGSSGSSNTGGSGGSTGSGGSSSSGGGSTAGSGTTPQSGSTQSTGSTAAAPTATTAPPPTATPTQRPTNTPVPPTNTPVPPTNTPVPTATDTPIPVPATAVPAASCDNISLSGTVSGSALTVTITNNNAVAVTVNNIDITWPTANGNITKIKQGATFANSYTPAAPPFISIPETAKKSVAAGGNTPALEFTFASAAASTGYTVVLSFDIGCTAAPFTR